MSTLVSCILATRDRPEFVRQALRCFDRQTHGDRELVVIDDGDLSVRDLCIGKRNVRYVRLPRTTTGAKLNIGIASAAGDVLQKIDDDDYYHPRFLETALAHIPAGEPHRAILAWDAFLILLAGEPQLRYSGPGWRVGGTLCFSRALWEEQPFRELPRSVDSRFLEDHRRRARFIPVHAPELYIVVRHGANTWKKFSDGERVESYFRKLPAYPKTIEQVIARGDWGFYRDLVNVLPPVSGRRRWEASPATPGRRPPQSG